MIDGALKLITHSLTGIDLMWRDEILTLNDGVITCKLTRAQTSAREHVYAQYLSGENGH